MGIDQWQRASMFRRGRAQADASFLEPGETARPSRPPPAPLSQKELQESAQRWARARLKDRVVSPEMAGLGLTAAMLTAVLNNLGPQAGMPVAEALPGAAPDQAAGRNGGSGGAGSTVMAGAEAGGTLDQGGSDFGIAAHGGRIAVATVDRPMARGTTIIPSNILRAEADAWAVREVGFAGAIGKAGLLAETAMGLGLVQAAEARVVGGVDAALLTASQARAVAEAGKAAKAAEGAKAVAQGDEAAQPHAAPGDTMHVAPARAVAVSQAAAAQVSQPVVDADDGVVAWAAPSPALASAPKVDVAVAGPALDIAGFGMPKAVAPAPAPVVAKAAVAEVKAHHAGSVVETVQRADAAAGTVGPARVDAATGSTVGHAAPAGVAAVTVTMADAAASSASTVIESVVKVPGPVAAAVPVVDLPALVVPAAAGPVAGHGPEAVAGGIGAVPAVDLGGLAASVEAVLDQVPVVGPVVKPEAPGVIDPVMPAGGPVAGVPPGVDLGGLTGPIGTVLDEVPVVGPVVKPEVPGVADPVVPVDGPVVGAPPVVEHGTPKGPVEAVLDEVP
ncbi:hypothetical protein JMJ56_09395, partial [Belnapia sp. T18]|nr:hypothetical protein [Belnapia arida]